MRADPQLAKKINSHHRREEMVEINVILDEKSVLGILGEEGGSRGLKHGAYCCGGRN